MLKGCHKVSRLAAAGTPVCGGSRRTLAQTAADLNGQKPPLLCAGTTHTYRRKKFRRNAERGLACKAA